MKQEEKLLKQIVGVANWGTVVLTEVIAKCAGGGMTWAEARDQVLTIAGELSLRVKPIGTKERMPK